MLLPGVMVTSEPGLLPSIMFGSMILPQLGFVMSGAYGATKGHTDVWGLGCFLWPCWCQGAMPPLGHAHLSVQLLPGTMILIVLDRATAEGHV